MSTGDGAEQQVRSLGAIALQVRTEIAVRQGLNTRFGMLCLPSILFAIVFQRTVADRKMVRLKHVLNDNSLGRLLAHDEAYGVRVAFLWKARTGMRITEIAAFKLGGAKFRSLMTMNRARAAPSRT